MSNPTELLNCPFCGGDAQTDFIEGESYLIECYACRAETGIKDSEEDAISAWNRRAALASRPAEVDDWISVDDRLPPKYEEVIVWPHPTDYCMTAELWGENASGNPVWKYGEYVNQWGHENVEITWGPITHWRNKLPAPSHTTNKEK